MLCCQRRMKRLAKTSAAFLALVFFGGCVSLTSTSSNRLDQQIAQADAAYKTLDADHVPGYNNAVESIARQIDGAKPDELRSQLDVRNGHSVCENPDAQREVIRILRLELHHGSPLTKR